MKRTARVAVELLAPPAVGAGLLLLYLACEGWRFTGQDLRELPALLGLAYVVAGLPSLAFMLAMELAFARGVAPRSWAGVLLAGGIGALSGLWVSVVLRFAVGGPVLRLLTVLGLSTGALVGLVVMASARMGERPGRPPLRLELPG